MGEEEGVVVGSCDERKGEERSEGDLLVIALAVASLQTLHLTFLMKQEEKSGSLSRFMLSSFSLLSLPSTAELKEILGARR